MNNSDNRKLSFWGASPIIFITTILYTMPVIYINRLLKPAFKINFIPDKILDALAVFLLCIGIPLYILTLKKLKSAYKKQELITNGVFSLCRNPLFAVVIFLLLPGILLFFNSWILLTIPVFMIIMFKIFINREERLMEKEFGQEYIEYKNNTSALFPKVWEYKK
jgi:protein-S-isoprenylcysteine O-methyltransferase Ste14